MSLDELPSQEPDDTEVMLLAGFTGSRERLARFTEESNGRAAFHPHTLTKKR